MEHEQGKRNTTKKSNIKWKGKSKKKKKTFSLPRQSLFWIHLPPYPTLHTIPFRATDWKVPPYPGNGIVSSFADRPPSCAPRHPRTFGVWERNLSAGSFFGWGCVSRMSTECAVRAPGSVLGRVCMFNEWKRGTFAGNVRDGEGGGGEKWARTLGEVWGMYERDSENRLVCWSDWVWRVFVESREAEFCEWEYVFLILIENRVMLFFQFLCVCVLVVCGLWLKIHSIHSDFFICRHFIQKKKNY